VQLDAIEELDPRVVTLTVGANDFLVPTFECAASMLDRAAGMACNLPDPRTALPALEANLHQILTRVTSETEALVAVTTYYNPFPRPSRCAPGLAEASLEHVNATIAGAVAGYADRAVLVDLMDVFRGHEGREPAGWFAPNPLRLACTDIHPNREGHRAIADAVWAAIGPRIR
jgi:lysophospholipase L1-like esterase